MRVVVVCDSLDRRGGSGTHLHAVIDAAVDAGHRVEVVCGRHRSEVRVPVTVLPTLARSRAGRRGRDGAPEPLERTLAGADVVHLQNVLDPELVSSIVNAAPTVAMVQDHRMFCPGPGRTLPDGSRCRRIVSDSSCADCLADSGYRRRMLELTRARLHALRGSVLAALSADVAEELAAAGASGAEVVPPWVDLSDAPPITGDRFLLTGRLVPHKAPGRAVAAWRAAGSPLPLVVAGSGPLEDELGDAVPLGWLPPERLRDEMRRSRALLFPTRWQEPFGLAGIEALAEATPVVAEVRGGMEEWAHAGCLRVPPGDMGAMADAIDRLAREPETARRLGEEGREMVRERFSRARGFGRLERLWERTAELRRPT